MSQAKKFPPLELLRQNRGAPAEPSHDVDIATIKTKRLERLYHLTHEHAWNGKAVLGALIDKHGPPGKNMPDDVKKPLARLLTVLMWGELAAWNISADLALGIDDIDAKMAATGQVFD